MLAWAIVFLVCLGYFMNEARRAPIVEDTAGDDARIDRLDERRFESPVAWRHSPCR